MRGTLRHIACLLLLAACGSRSGLAELSPDPTVDAATPADAGTPRPDPPPRPRDAGWDAGRDAGPPPGPCELSAGEPRTIFIDESGSFDAPQAVYRDGAFDLLATFFPEDDSRIPVPYGSRFDARLEPAGGLAGGIMPSDAQRAAAAGDVLAICSRRLASGQVEVVGFRGGTDRWATSLGPGSCRAVAGSDGQLLAAFRPDSPPDSALLVSILDTTAGSMVLWPSHLRSLTMPVPDGGVSLSAFRGGFAWVLTPDAERRLELGVITSGGVFSHHVITDVHAAWAPPAIAPWPYDPEGALAVVNHGPGGVRLHVVDAESGAERLRTEPFAFSMGGDVTPALLPRPEGLVVAMLNYGDFDPHGGLLDIVLLGPSGEVRSRWTGEARRWDLYHGGIALASDGETMIVHWADVSSDTGITDLPITRAMTLRCE